MSHRPPTPPSPAGPSSSRARPTAPGEARRLVLQPAIIRPDSLGRTHPDPRADPPTEAFIDPSGAPTERLREVATDTDRIPTVAPAVSPDVRAPQPPDPEPDDPVVTQAGAPGAGRALALSSLLGALAGLLGWLVAARVMPTADVGDAQLVVSAFLLVGGMGAGLVGWLPAAGRRTGRLVWSWLLLIVPLSGLVALGYGLLTPRLAAVAGSAGAAPALGLLFFVLACTGLGVFAVHDFLLTAAGKPWWTLWRGGLFALVQIGLLVVIAVFAGLGAYGVVLSWVGPIVVWVVLGSAVIAVLTRRFSGRAVDGAAASRAEVLSFLGPAVVAHLGAALLHHQVPIMVNVRFGAETAAVFFIAWQAVLVVDLAAALFLSSLVARVAREPHRAAEPAAAARRRLLFLFVPALALGAALATPLLTIFGTAYAEADDVLRLLLLGAAFRLVVVHELSVRLAAGRALGVALLQLLSTMLVLGVAIVAPDTGAGATVLLPVAIGYIAVQAACMAAVLVFPAGRRADVEVRSP